jgi:pre-mRNA-splicing factor CDC5/CEF1
MRQELRTGLGSLPAPKNEYQIMVPEMGDDQDDDAEPMEEVRSLSH